MSLPETSGATSMRRKILVALPLVLFLALAAVTARAARRKIA